MALFIIFLSLLLIIVTNASHFFDADAAFLNASEHGCIQGIKEALAKGAHMGTRNNQATSPLIFASNNGHLKAVRYLLDLGADLEACSNNGRTSLMWACFWGHFDVVQYLVSRGANLDTVDAGISFLKYKAAALTYLVRFFNAYSCILCIFAFT